MRHVLGSENGPDADIDLVEVRGGAEGFVGRRCPWVRVGPNNGSHSITSSARARIVGDSSIPNILAMRRLILRSNLVGRSKGRSAGFAPFRMRSTCEIK